MTEEGKTRVEELEEEVRQRDLAISAFVDEQARLLSENDRLRAELAAVESKR